MNIKEKIQSLKEKRELVVKIKEYKKSHGDIVTASELKDYLDMGVVPVPIYQTPTRKAKPINLNKVVSVRRGRVIKSTSPKISLKKTHLNIK